MIASAPAKYPRKMGPADRQADLPAVVIENRTLFFQAARSCVWMNSRTPAPDRLPEKPTVACLEYRFIEPLARSREPQRLDLPIPPGRTIADAEASAGHFFSLQTLACWPQSPDHYEVADGCGCHGNTVLRRDAPQLDWSWCRLGKYSGAQSRLPIRNASTRRNQHDGHA